MKIPKGKKVFIDSHFDETDDPTREEFEHLTTPEELHYVALNYSWERGVEVMQWIVESNLCSEATALMIFWLAQPDDYTKYKLNAQKLPRYVEIEVFNLIRTVLDNFKNGFYKKTDISYDPKEDMPECVIVPKIMFQPTKGEEPYIYYEKKEIDLWFGEYLDNQISRCDNAIDLFNIASLLGYNNIKVFEQIINHPHCDKGVALMIFWHLKTRANPYGIEHISREIIQRFNSQEHKEVLRYNPEEDKEVKIKQQWTIPGIMKKAING